ncbi:protein MIS12 homolog isoform X1 [Hypomesus transpacificus]|uniref:protein MIS12 homolog isoform X1 n=1 Tax=Hypomesus transpacificus TaxID=137520 RepID=UPI001F071BAB|nr:protein MIS12 homolog isoform X1 [Hypomesus transpacificus]
MAREFQDMAEVRVYEEEAPSALSLNLNETQFFGFTPQTCMLRVYSAFQDCLYEMLLVVEKVFVRKLSGTELSDDQLRLRARECTQKLQLFLQERFKRLSGCMETLLVKNVFSIPPNVPLPGNQPRTKHIEGLSDLLELESCLTELQQSYQAEVCAQQALLAELEEQRVVQEQLDGILKWIGELQAAWMKEGMGNFHDSFRVMVQSVKKLQDVITDISKKSSGLDSSMGWSHVA